jgi:hypothetical protein
VLDLKELAKWIDFLDNLCINLESFPPDYAILLTYKIVFQGKKSLINTKISLASIFLLIYNHFTSNRVKILISYVEKLILKDSKIAQSKLRKMNERLKLQRSIGKRRIQELKAQKFKIYCFVFVLPIILGVLAGLYPLFSSIMEISGKITIADVLEYGSFSSSWQINPVLFFFGLLLFALISTYNFSKIILQQRWFPLLLLSCCIFLITFLLGFNSQI